MKLERSLKHRASEFQKDVDLEKVVSKSRDYWYDNAKALLIITVIIGHLANGEFSTTTDWILALQKYIYIFHMPVFMIISGRFSKRRVEQRDFDALIANVLIPYFIAQTFMAIWYTAVGYSSANDFSYFDPLFGLWYFMALAFYLWLTPYLKKFHFLFPVSIAVALVGGFALKDLWGAIHRTVMYYPFFLFGYYTVDCKFLFFKKWWFRILSIIVFLGTAVYVISDGKEISLNLLCLNTNYWTIMKDMGLSVSTVFLEAILRYVAAFLSFGIIMGITPCRKMFYSYVGTHSIYVYVLHLFFIIGLRGIDNNFDVLRCLTSDIRLIVYLCFGVVLGFILASRPVRKIFHCFLEPDISLNR